jgi:hypothetical protein
MDLEDNTLTDITDEPESPLEKPKRKASEKQLLALANAREKRKTKKTALEMVPAPPPMVLKKEPIGKVVRLPEPKPLPKPKLKRAEPKPTIIQIESDDTDSGSGSDSDGPPPAPTIIIRNGSKKRTPEAKPKVPEPPTAPRQYIRRAY